MENRRDRGRRLATGALAHMASRKAAAVATAILLLAFLVLVWTNVSPAENGAGGEPAAHAWRESEEASGKDGGTGSGTQSDASEASEPAAEGGQLEEASSSREEATGKAAGSSDNSGNKGNSSSKKDEGKSDSKPSGGNSSNSGSNSNSGSSSKKDDTPAHQHNWVAQTKTVHHDAQYKTVHHDAVTHQVWHDAVTEEHYICNQCGADITSDPWGHLNNSVMNGGNCGSYHSTYVTVKQGYYETVTDQAAYDEQVQVRDAWDETVTTGYKCSSCGATK